MKVYVVTDDGIETGTFCELRKSTVSYRTTDGVKREHIRNVFFKKRNARYYRLRSFGITRPVVNGTA